MRIQEPSKSLDVPNVIDDSHVQVIRAITASSGDNLVKLASDAQLWRTKLTDSSLWIPFFNKFDELIEDTLLVTKDSLTTMSTVALLHPHLIALPFILCDPLAHVFASWESLVTLAERDDVDPVTRLLALRVVRMHPCFGRKRHAVRDINRKLEFRPLPQNSLKSLLSLLSVGLETMDKDVTAAQIFEEIEMRLANESRANESQDNPPTFDSALLSDDPLPCGRFVFPGGLSLSPTLLIPREKLSSPNKNSSSREWTGFWQRSAIGRHAMLALKFLALELSATLIPPPGLGSLLPSCPGVVGQAVLVIEGGATRGVKGGLASTLQEMLIESVFGFASALLHDGILAEPLVSQMRLSGSSCEFTEGLANGLELRTQDSLTLSFQFLKTLYESPIVGSNPQAVQGLFSPDFLDSVLFKAAVSSRNFQHSAARAMSSAIDAATPTALGVHRGRWLSVLGAKIQESSHGVECDDWMRLAQQLLEGSTLSRDFVSRVVLIPNERGMALLAAGVNADPAAVPDLLKRGVLGVIETAMFGSNELSHPLLPQFSAAFALLAALALHSEGETAVLSLLEKGTRNLWRIAASTPIALTSEGGGGKSIGALISSMVRNRPGQVRSITAKSSALGLKDVTDEIKRLGFVGGLIHGAAEQCKLIEALGSNVDTASCLNKEYVPLFIAELIDTCGDASCRSGESSRAGGSPVAPPTVIAAEAALRSIVQAAQQLGTLPGNRPQTAEDLQTWAAQVFPYSCTPCSCCRSCLKPSLGFVLKVTGVVLKDLPPNAPSKGVVEEFSRVLEFLKGTSSVSSIAISDPSSCPALQLFPSEGLKNFLCQISRIANHPQGGGNRQGNRKPAAVASPAVLHALNEQVAVISMRILDRAVGLAELVGEAGVERESGAPIPMPTSSPTPSSIPWQYLLDTVEFLAKLHIEDKHHMTRTLALYRFCCLGGAEALARLTAVACRSDAEQAAMVVQGSLWWFERTTSLKRMQNAQITGYLVQIEGEKGTSGGPITYLPTSSSSPLTPFDPVTLSLYLQNLFGSFFLPFWRSDPVIARFTAKAAASVLKAFTHVLEPANSSNYPIARDTGKDFISRALELGSISSTAGLPGQTHISDVCVRISHNRFIKLGGGIEEGSVFAVDSSNLMLSSNTASPVPTASIPLDQASSSSRPRTANSTELVFRANSSSGMSTPQEVKLTEISEHNVRHIASVCLDALSTGVERRKKIAGNILLCLLVGRQSDARRVIGGGLSDAVICASKTAGTEKSTCIPSWFIPGLLALSKAPGDSLDSVEAALEICSTAWKSGCTLSSCSGACFDPLLLQSVLSLLIAKSCPLKKFPVLLSAPKATAYPTLPPNLVSVLTQSIRSDSCTISECCSQLKASAQTGNLESVLDKFPDSAIAAVAPALKMIDGHAELGNISRLPIEGSVVSEIVRGLFDRLMTGGENMAINPEVALFLLDKAKSLIPSVFNDLEISSRLLIDYQLNTVFPALLNSSTDHRLLGIWCTRLIDGAELFPAFVREAGAVKKGEDKAAALASVALKMGTALIQSEDTFSRRRWILNWLASVVDPKGSEVILECLEIFARPSDDELKSLTGSSVTAALPPVRRPRQGTPASLIEPLLRRTGISRRNGTASSDTSAVRRSRVMTMDVEADDAESLIVPRDDAASDDMLPIPSRETEVRFEAEDRGNTGSIFGSEIATVFDDEEDGEHPVEDSPVEDPVEEEDDEEEEEEQEEEDVEMANNLEEDEETFNPLARVLQIPGLSASLTQPLNIFPDDSTSDRMVFSLSTGNSRWGRWSFATTGGDVHPLIARSHTGTTVREEVREVSTALGSSRVLAILNRNGVDGGQTGSIEGSLEESAAFPTLQPLNLFGTPVSLDDLAREFSVIQRRSSSAGSELAAIEPRLQTGADDPLTLAEGTRMTREYTLANEAREPQPAAAQSYGVEAIANYARRLRMTEQQLVESSGLDPSVLREMPDFMHAEILREFMDNLDPRTRQRVLETARGSAGRAASNNVPERPVIVRQLMERPLADRPGLLESPESSTQLRTLRALTDIMRGSGNFSSQLNRILRLVDRKSGVDVLAGQVGKAREEAVRKSGGVAASYYSGYNTLLPAESVSTLLSFVWLPSLKSSSKVALESLLSHMCLCPVLRVHVLGSLMKLLERVVGSTGQKIPCDFCSRMVCYSEDCVFSPDFFISSSNAPSNVSATLASRLMSILNHLLEKVPGCKDWFSDPHCEHLNPDQNIGLLVSLIGPSGERLGTGASAALALNTLLEKNSTLPGLLSPGTAKALVTAAFGDQQHKKILRAVLAIAKGAPQVRQEIATEIKRYVEGLTEQVRGLLLGVTRTDTRLDERRLPRHVKLLYEIFGDIAAFHAAGLGALWQVTDSLISQPHQHSILLPLVEGFLLACQLSAGGELDNTPVGPVVGSQRSPTAKFRNFFAPSANAFLKFCEGHRAALNALITASPGCLSRPGFNAIPSNCPWVLDFDNKRQWFRTRVESIRSNGGLTSIQPALRINVRRHEVFIDSFHQLRHRPGSELRGRLAIHFSGEEGVDAGGLLREWFGILAREIFNPNYVLFLPCSGKASTFQINPASGINPDHLSFYEFCGKFIGKAVLDDVRIEAYFSRSIYRQMLGKAVSWEDMEAEDPDYFKQLSWILETNLRDAEAATVAAGLDFTVAIEEFGSINTVELVPGGASITVTEENKSEYVRLLCEHKMTKSVQPQLDAFLRGFHEIVPVPLLGNLFDDKELELLISGLPEIDLVDLKANTEYVNYTPNSPQVQWLWKVVSEFSREERAQFLQFVTGSSQVPLEGFKALMGMRGPQKMSVHRSFGGERLPTAHTCFNQLDLPEYSGYEILRAKLRQAVLEGHEGFGFV